MEIADDKVYKVVQDVLADNGVVDTPVPVVELVQNYGYDVVESELPSSTSGFVDVDSNNVYINKDNSQEYKIFTIMVALGLILLHESDIEETPDLGVIHRVPLGRKDISDELKDAIKFAEAILIPSHKLENIVSKYKDVASLRSISIFFGVPRQVVAHRLKSLGVDYVGN
ncbi:ImmA/IrrE family metallo-endopeptidase [Candidatus Dojkabacteria bacterium]|nr:ImmA/IrrE family metallo-endopeptidase [Candidatus Dojkabacteria bacterium]